MYLLEIGVATLLVALALVGWRVWVEIQLTRVRIRHERKKGEA